MATTTQYLEQLAKDKQDIINSLKEKGLTVDDNATFTDLVPQVESLGTGGGDLGEYFTNTISAMSNSAPGITKIVKKTPSDLTISGTSGVGLFKNATELVEVPHLDTSNITNASSMFSGCSKLTTIPSKLDTTKCTNFGDMFYGCSKLKTVPEMDTSKGTNLSNMFSNCYQLISISSLNTSVTTTLSSTFNGCSNLMEIPDIDASNTTTTANMCYSCSKLTSINITNTQKVVRMTNMFYGCSRLETVSAIDCSSCIDVEKMFQNDTNLKNLGGFINLGQAYATSQSENYTKYTLSVGNGLSLTHDSLMNIINNVYDIKSKGCKNQKLIFGSTNLAKLTDEEKQIAINKGWNLS